MTVRNLVSVELKHSVHLQLSMQGQRTDSDDEVMSDEILGLSKVGNVILTKDPV